MAETTEVVKLVEALRREAERQRDEGLIVEDECTAILEYVATIEELFAE